MGTWRMEMKNSVILRVSNPASLELTTDLTKDFNQIEMGAEEGDCEVLVDDHRRIPLKA